MVGEFGRNYIENCTNSDLRGFIKHFSSLSKTEGGQKFLEDNLREILLTSEKMLGVNVREFNSSAMGFYRTLGLERCANHLINVCFASRKETKRNLAIQLFTELENPSKEVLDALYFGHLNERVRDGIEEVLQNYRERDVLDY